MSANDRRARALASARIAARAENHLAQIEWRLARVGQAVALGHADRNTVVDRIRAALVRAGLAAGATR
jgi:predicted nuclease with TOPRIM domain